MDGIAVMFYLAGVVFLRHIKASWFISLAWPIVAFSIIMNLVAKEK